MKKKQIPLPPPSEKVEENNEANIEAWKKYFQNLSPRIQIKMPTVEELETTRKAIVEHLTIEGKLLDWPDISQVAFALAIDSALPGQKARFLIDDTYLFCYGDLAFSLTHFEADVDEECLDKESGDFIGLNYSLDSFKGEDLLSYKFIATIILKTLKRLVKGQAVKNVPKNI